MTPLELVKSSVNRHGELHLSKEQTAALLSWLTQCEQYEIGTKRLFDELCDTIKPLGISLEKLDKGPGNNATE